MTLDDLAPESAPTVHPDVSPIYPDDDAPVYEGYKVRLPAQEGYAFFPDSVYESSETALEAAIAWASCPAPDRANTRNVIRIEIPEKKETRPPGEGRKRTIKTRRATYGWQVRMQRQGQSYSQFFNDNHFGGSEGALKAAQFWRDWRGAPLKRTPPDTMRERSRLSRSQFGVPGLRTLLIHVGNGRYAPYLQVSWPASDEIGETKRERVTMSLEKHDPEEATARLCDALVRARGRRAIPDPGQPGPDLSTENQRQAAREVAGRLGLAVADDADLSEVFAEAFARAWPSVQERLPDLRRKAAARSAAGPTS